ncbi:hypothetical protein [Streptomyces sp. NBC_01022]|uniref:hypothetical protein n=1 Tax=Streptomyces sp. NBC_01022 TaxID=2903723 RepID=UPI002DD7F0E2|nr:hypothetical protein [Streptomyces sp. NBC_01022]WRZ86088.1 hypothetical protein OG316_40325 [Streptomyces sp. NBC_01022]
MSVVRGRPGKPSSGFGSNPNAYIGWLARTHRYNATDLALATASTFAAHLEHLPGARPVGPAMISRLESGSATWQREHLSAYETLLNLPQGQLLAPAYKIFGVLGRQGAAPLVQTRYSAHDEQRAADLVDTLTGDDPATSVDWDFLSGYLLTSGRRLGRRTWESLCERLLLELCASQGLDQEIRAEALVRFAHLDLATDIANEVAQAVMVQKGNPTSFMPLKVFQQIPEKAPAAWISRALLNPPDRWLLRELFSSVAVLVGSGTWHPSSERLRAIRRESIETTLDNDIELEVRRSSLQLFRALQGAGTGGAARALPPGATPELLYLAKADSPGDQQKARYKGISARVAAEIQAVGLRSQSKWARGEDPGLGLILQLCLFGRSDDLRSASTSILTSSGYVDPLRAVLARDLNSGKLHEDRVVARAFIRIFGKVAAGPGDGGTLLRAVCSEHIDIDTRIQACWALANAGPRLPRAVTDSALEACRRRSFGAQSVTALRAAVATCGRSSNTQALQTLLDDPTTALSVRDECNWWRSLPRHVLPIPSDTKEAVVLQVPRGPERHADTGQ